MGFTWPSAIQKASRPRQKIVQLLNSAWIQMREQIMFKTMTKNWQTVNRRNVRGQIVSKSWPGHRKRPCTNSRATIWRYEKMVGWWRTEWWSTQHVGQPSERSEVFWSVAVKNSVHQDRQFELNTFWDAQPMQWHQSFRDMVESPESVDCRSIYL